MELNDDLFEMLDPLVEGGDFVLVFLALDLGHLLPAKEDLELVLLTRRCLVGCTLLPNRFAEGLERSVNRRRVSVSRGKGRPAGLGLAVVFDGSTGVRHHSSDVLLVLLCEFGRAKLLFPVGEGAATKRTHAGCFPVSADRGLVLGWISASEARLVELVDWASEAGVVPVVLMILERTIVLCGEYGSDAVLEAGRPGGDEAWLGLH
mmetsp:Transcript_34141/g.53385  ORF Transcript_34141/g.53385 Transcript_34141/m.53385 type:complete len:206 (+) Transcript_34141:410-1027(+)